MLKITHQQVFPKQETYADMKRGDICLNEYNDLVMRTEGNRWVYLVDGSSTTNPNHNCRILPPGTKFTIEVQ